MDLFFAEHDYQVQDIIKKLDCGRGNWIALGPSAMHFLHKKGIPYHIPEDFCNSHEVEETCVSHFQQLTEVCHGIDNILIEHEPFLKEWGIRPFLLHLWELGVIFDGLAGRILQLKKILAAFPKTRSYIHLAPVKYGTTTAPGFAKKETLWGRILTLPGWKNRVVTIPDPFLCPQTILNSSYRKTMPAQFEKYITLKIMTNFKLLNAVSSFRYGIPANGLKTLLPAQTNGNPNIMVLGNPYDWQHLLPSLVKSGKRISFWKDTLVKNTSDSSISHPWKNDTEKLWNNFCDAIIKGEINYASILKDKICCIIENSTNKAREIISKLKKTVSEKNFRLILNASSNHFEDYVTRQFFLKKNVPVFNWQYGMVWHDKRITQRMDLLNMHCNSVCFTYGESVKRAYAASDFKTSCKFKSVGSASLDKIQYEKKINHGKDCKLLYVITSYYQNSWYCGFSPPFSDRLYFREQTIIIRRLKNFVKTIDNVSVTVKLYPHTHFLDQDPPWVNDVTNENSIKLLRSKATFIELMRTHDAVLIDSPTTTLLQAIATNLPVFALTSIISPPRDDINILQGRAVCTENAEKLMEELEIFLKTGHYKPDINNRDFLKFYGTHLDDKKSSERAEKLISEALQHEIKELKNDFPQGHTETYSDKF